LHCANFHHSVDVFLIAASYASTGPCRMAYAIQPTKNTPGPAG
jgi:hypothetical protein